MKNIKYIFILVILPNIEHLLRIYFAFSSKDCLSIEKLLNNYNVTRLIFIIEILIFLFFVLMLFKFFKNKKKLSNNVMILIVLLIGQLLFVVGWFSPLYDCLLDR